MRNNRNDSQFPDRIRVDSPDIQTINQTTQRISNWLHNDFVEVIKPLQVLPTLPGILEDFKNRLVEQFRMHFSGQVAIQMKAREVNIKVAERKYHFLEGQIDRRRELLQQQSERIETRYNNMAEQTANEHSSFLRQLDQHVYQITEGIYPEQIQEKFSFISQPFWRQLAQRAEESSIARSICLDEGYRDVRLAMERFLDERRDAYAQEQAQETGLAEGAYELPYWYAVVEDQETGEQTTHIMFPWDAGQPQASGSGMSRQARDLAAELLRSGGSPQLTYDVVEQVAVIARDDFGLSSEQVAQFKADLIAKDQQQTGQEEATES